MNYLNCFQNKSIKKFFLRCLLYESTLNNLKDLEEIAFYTFVILLCSFECSLLKEVIEKKLIPKLYDDNINRMYENCKQLSSEKFTENIYAYLQLKDESIYPPYYTTSEVTQYFQKIKCNAKKAIDDAEKSSRPNAYYSTENTQDWFNSYLNILLKFPIFYKSFKKYPRKRI